MHLPLDLAPLRFLCIFGNNSRKAPVIAIAHIFKDIISRWATLSVLLGQIAPHHFLFVHITSVPQGGHKYEGCQRPFHRNMLKMVPLWSWKRMITTDLRFDNDDTTVDKCLQRHFSLNHECTLQIHMYLKLLQHHLLGNTSFQGEGRNLRPIRPSIRHTRLRRNEERLIKSSACAKGRVRLIANNPDEKARKDASAKKYSNLIINSTVCF